MDSDDEARALIRLIRRQLAQTVDWENRHVLLTWTDYELLLEYRRLAWRPHDRSLDARHDDRPLTTFDGLPLLCSVYANPNSRIEGRRSDGMITALAIPPR